MSIRDFTRPASSTESEDVYEGHRLNDDALFKKLSRNNTHEVVMNKREYKFSTAHD